MPRTFERHQAKLASGTTEQVVLLPGKRISKAPSSFVLDVDIKTVLRQSVVAKGLRL